MACVVGGTDMTCTTPHLGLAKCMSADCVTGKTRPVRWDPAMRGRAVAGLHELVG